MSGLEESANNRKHMELHAQYLIKSVEEIEATNRQLRSGKRKQQKTTAEDTSSYDLEYSSPSIELLTQHELRDRSTSLPLRPNLLRSNRALADDLSSCVGVPAVASLPIEDNNPTTSESNDAADRLKEIQSNAELKIRRLLHRINHLEEQLAIAQSDNERLKLMASEPPQEEDSTQQYVNKLLVQKRSLIQENAKLKRELLSTCNECRNGRTNAGKEPTSPARRPTFQSSARHVLENLPKQGNTATKQQRKSLQEQRRAWSTTTQQSWNPRHQQSK